MKDLLLEGAASLLMKVMPDDSKKMYQIFLLNFKIFKNFHSKVLIIFK
jgi:hypothetical protein